MNHIASGLLFLFVSGAFSFDVSRSVDRAALTLGDTLLFKISAVKKPGQKILFPGLDASYGDFELKNLASTEVKKGDGVVETYSYTLAVFKLGDVKIPSMRVVAAADTADFKLTEPVDLAVKPVTAPANAADTSDIADIYPQENIGYGFWFYAIIILVLLLLVFIFFLIKRALRKKDIKTSAPVIVLSPEEQFEKDMHELEAARFLEKGDIKEFHLKTSEILRRYLGGRLGFEALESTTYELLHALRKKNIEKAALRLVEDFCEINDPVKFAKWIPDSATSEKLIPLSRELVRLLTPPRAASPVVSAKKA